MGKRILSIVLAITMLITIVPCVYAEEEIARGTCGDNLTWTLDSEGTLTISGTGDMKKWNLSTAVPWDSSRENIKTIVIENGVTSIEDRVFKDCVNLTDVTIPDSVTSIGDMVFSNTALYNDDSNWENDVLYINNHLIEAKSNVTGTYAIKSGTKTIAKKAFYECRGLTSVTIPDSVTNIEDYAFAYCSGLTSVTIPNNVTGIGDRVFYYCSGLKSITVDEENANYTSVDGVLFNEDKTILIQYPIGNTNTNYNIPNSVVNIGYSAFE